jgi:lysophospholipase L1-like esterase
MRKLTTSVALIFAALLAALLVACGGDDSDPSASASSSVTPTKIATSGSLTPGAATPTSAPNTATVGPSLINNTPKPEPTPVNSLGDEKLYLSLGDSLAAGNGSSDKSRTAWVALTYQGLGPGYEVHNLGHAGDDSDDLINRQLDPAVSEMQTRLNDGIPGNETAVITLEIGGNDLLHLYDSLVLTGLCPSVTESLKKPECVEGLRNALDHYRPNLEQILDRLKAADPNVPIFLMTLYNPFSGASENLDAIGALALEGQDGTPFPEGLNDTIRQVGAEKGAIVVDWYPLFIGKAYEYIAQDLIHPNDTGQSVMAQALLAAMSQHGLR